MAIEARRRIRVKVALPPERGDGSSDRIKNPPIKAKSERLTDTGNPSARREERAGKLPGVMEDDIWPPTPHQRLQVVEHGGRQHLTEQVREIPAENLGWCESVVRLVREMLGQARESGVDGESRLEGRKAGGFGAGTQIRTDSYRHLMARIRERPRQRKQRLEMAVGGDG